MVISRFTWLGQHSCGQHSYGGHPYQMLFEVGNDVPSAGPGCKPSPSPQHKVESRGFRIKVPYGNHNGNRDKARYDREMKNYVPPKGDKKGKKKDPNAPKRPPSAFFLFCAEHRPKIKSEHPGLSIGDTAKKLGELWSEQSAKDKLPYEQKVAKLKEKYEKDIAAYRAKGKGDVGKKGPGRPTGSKKKNEPDEEEEDEDEEDEDEEEDDEE
ncbi:high mobility group protein B2-like [Trichosurus vulpecula]|uniref:high mobility group protein B2-like n=1 Tax=Trichosurus vulpecula TaxID=9337 RepID=UPI00186B4D1A|nr:high mobility group protein B2-like [Trichosurus vulpecula]